MKRRLLLALLTFALTACGFHTTVIDHHAEMVEGLAKHGIKTYYGDATKPELLNSIGLAQAKLLVIAIGQRKEATEILEFVRRHYPKLPVLARAYDSPHAYELHHAGADFVIRATADSSIRSGRIALEQLGLSPEKARELSKLYAARERHQLAKLSKYYDPNLPLFANGKIIEMAKESDAETARMMQTLMQGGTVEWQEDPGDWTWLKKGIA